VRRPRKTIDDHIEELGEATGARRRQEETGGAKKSQEEPGRAWRSQEEPGGGWRRTEEKEEEEAPCGLSGAHSPFLVGASGFQGP
jgi:hypothetical protein